MKILRENKYNEKNKSLDIIKFLYTSLYRKDYSILNIIKNKQIIKYCNKYYRCEKCQDIKYVKRCIYYHLNNNIHKHYQHFENYLDNYFKGFLKEIYLYYKEEIIYTSIDHVEYNLRDEYEKIFNVYGDYGHKQFKNSLLNNIIKKCHIKKIANCINQNFLTF